MGRGGGRARAGCRECWARLGALRTWRNSERAPQNTAATCAARRTVSGGPRGARAWAAARTGGGAGGEGQPLCTGRAGRRARRGGRGTPCRGAARRRREQAARCATRASLPPAARRGPTPRARPRTCAPRSGAQRGESAVRRRVAAAGAVGEARAPCQADGAAGAQGLGGRVALEEGGAKPEREEHRVAHKSLLGDKLPSPRACRA